MHISMARRPFALTLESIAIIFIFLIAVLVGYFIFAYSQLEVRFLVEDQGKITVPEGETVDIFFLLENKGMKAADVENVFIYDVEDGQALRTARSYPKQSFLVWPKDEKLVHMQIEQPHNKQSVTVGINIAYRGSDELVKEEAMRIQWIMPLQNTNNS